MEANTDLSVITEHQLDFCLQKRTEYESTLSPTIRPSTHFPKTKHHHHF